MLMRGPQAAAVSALAHAATAFWDAMPLTQPVAFLNVAVAEAGVTLNPEQAATAFAILSNCR